MGRILSSIAMLYRALRNCTTIADAGAVFAECGICSPPDVVCDDHESLFIEQIALLVGMDEETVREQLDSSDWSIGMGDE